MTGLALQTTSESNSTERLWIEPEHPRSVDFGIKSGAQEFAPGRAVRPFDPTHVLGCGVAEALQLFHGRRVTPGEAEAIAARSYRWRRHLHDPDSYWITTIEAARIIELTPRQVKGLLDRGQLQHVRHISRVRLMRRAHIVALAESRY